MIKGIRFRIYPNREQRNFIELTFGCCRFIYNQGLALRKDTYQNGGKANYALTNTMLTELKHSEDYQWLKEVDSIALQQSLRELEYKAAWYGRTIIKVPTFYPSSQTCYVCGYKNPDVKNLAVRKWECPICHTLHDRDQNAATNILNRGMKQIAV